MSHRRCSGADVTGPAVRKDYCLCSLDGKQEVLEDVGNSWVQWRPLGVISDVATFVAFIKSHFKGIVREIGK